jgi:hypothetical protein
LGWLLLNALRHGTVRDKNGFQIARMNAPVYFWVIVTSYAALLSVFFSVAVYDVLLATGQIPN